jgi:hypothetical protein
LYTGGLREVYVCDVLSSGFGASVLAFFGALRGGLLLLDMVEAPSGRVRGAWVTYGWGLGGVFELVWRG